MSVVVTNKEIYNKVCSIEKHVIHTNGKVKLNRWIAGIAFGFAMLALNMQSGVLL